VTDVEREIASQPDVWRAATARAAEARGILPPDGARIVAVGCGTSLYVSQAYASLREAAGGGVTDAFPASEVPMARDVDAVVAISRSGTTTEVARVLERLPEQVPSVAITAVAGTPVPEAASATILLEFADERSVVQTRFATTVLALLRACLGEDLEAPIADAGRALERPLPAGLERFEHFVFLGHGWTAGLANEAALKMREAARAWSESYPAMEFRHGPISVAGPASLVWALGDVPGDLLDDVRATGATVVESQLDPMAELVVIQRAAVALAESRGFDPDRPRHLTRSVVLPG
jgi:fructoselysine-6-P-deglycase FrlB-like protein